MIDPRSAFPPYLTIDPSAKQLTGRLPVDVVALVGQLVKVMEHAAQVNSVPVTRTELVGNRDSEDSTERLEIRQWVHVPGEKAMGVWDKVGREIDYWVHGLHPVEADLVTEWTAFAVYSDVDDAAA